MEDATGAQSSALLTADENATGQEEKKSKTQEEKLKKRRGKVGVCLYHGDLVKDDFWLRRPWILTGGVGAVKEL